MLSFQSRLNKLKPRFRLLLACPPRWLFGIGFDRHLL
jgi:hypothetical protein